MKNTSIFTFLMVLVVTSHSYAQSINSHFFRFSDTLETIMVEDALGPESELAQHRFMLRVSYDFVEEPFIRLNGDRDDQTGQIVDDIHAIQLGGSIVLTDRILVGVTVPFYFSEVDTTQVNATDADSWELGDIHWKVKFRLTNDERDVNVAFMPWGFFPTGRNDQDNNYLISDDSYGIGGKFLFDTTLGRFTLYGNVGLSYADNAEFLSVDRRLRVDLGAGAYLRILDWLGLNGELINGYTVSSFEKDQNPVLILFGARAKIGPLRAFVGTGLEALRPDRSNKGSFYAGLKMPFGSRDKPDVIISSEAVTEIEPSVVKKIQILKENLSVRREINFETDKAVIKEESFPELDSAAEIIMAHEDYIENITIEGHTDSRGTEAYNQKLSERRANSVRDYLIARGVDGNKLSAVGYGESRLKVQEVDAASLLINRRVEFIVDKTIETQKEIQFIEYPDGTVEENPL